MDFKIAKTRQGFIASCPRQGCAFQSKGSEERSCRTGMQRHIREKHSKRSKMILEKRRQQQRSRIAALRKALPALAKPAPAAMKRPASSSTSALAKPAAAAMQQAASSSTSDLAKPAPAAMKRPATSSTSALVNPAPATVKRPDQTSQMFAVLSPRFREAEWERARSELLNFGVPISQIVRRTGIDFQAYSSGNSSLQRDLPEGLKRNTFLHFDFTEKFLPWCSTTFARETQLSVIWWVEDDVCMNKTHKEMDEFMQSSLQETTPLLWFGYLRQGEKPRWGSHLLGVTRAGLPRLMNYVRDSRSSGVGKVGSHLQALDTWVYNLLAKKDSMVKASSTSWAGQRKHERKGRR